VKNYVLDTNVLLHDPSALRQFEDNRVLIPIEVIEEIDAFKKQHSELGQNARSVSRALDTLREQGNLSDGVQLDGGGRLRILLHEVNGRDYPAPRGDNGHETPGKGNGSMNVDSRIVAQALAVKDQQPDVPTILVTKDINLRIKADALGLQAQNYQSDRINLRNLYTGAVELSVPREEIDAFHANKELPLTNAEAFSPNEFVTLVDEANPKKSALGRARPAEGKVVAILDTHRGVWGIKARNREQQFALDALLNDEVKLVTLMGMAGTGKTLLALAAALKLTVHDKEYRRVMVARPTVSLGREMGYLPGTLEEKLSPWMQPIHDALEMLSDLNMGGERMRSSDLLNSGTISIEALSYIRGRSIANQFMIIDEAQNLTPLEVKTILTRVGHGTKIVFTGDPYQIDNPYIDAASNGFTYAVTKFRDQPIAAHVELKKGERSQLAELAANIL
jgi:PhoH-like ATPase